MGHMRDARCESPGCAFKAVEDQSFCARHGGSYPVRTGVAPIDHMALCGATRRDGGACTQPRMRGQTRCRMHGAANPYKKELAVRTMAEEKAAELARRHSIPRGISATAALQEELDRTQGRIDFLEQQLAERPADQAVMAVFTAERNHLRQLAGGMVTAKVEERRRVVTEQELDQLEAALTATLRDLGVDPTDNVRRLLGEHLAASAKTQKPVPVTAEVVRPPVWVEPVVEPVAF